MKNANISRMVKNFAFTALFALLSFAPVFQAQAQDKGKEDSVEIKYLGSVGNQPIFQIEFDNPNEEEVLVSLRDSAGEVLYQERFRDKKFSRKFKLERSEEDLNVVLSVSSKKDRFTQQYQINRNTRIIEDVSVTRVR